MITESFKVKVEWWKYLDSIISKISSSIYYLEKM